MSESEVFNAAFGASLKADNRQAHDSGNAIGGRLKELEDRVNAIESFLLAENKKFKPAPARKRQISPLAAALAAAKPGPTMKIRPVEPTVSDLDRSKLNRRQ